MWSGERNNKILFQCLQLASATSQCSLAIATNFSSTLLSSQNCNHGKIIKIGRDYYLCISFDGTGRQTPLFREN